MFKANLFKLKIGKKEKWLKWSSSLKEREKEVISTLDEESVLIEGCSTFSLNNEDYIILFMYYTKVLNKVTEREINKLHIHNISDCLEFVHTLDNNYIFSAFK